MMRSTRSFRRRMAFTLEVSRYATQHYSSFDFLWLCIHESDETLELLISKHAVIQRT